MKDLEDGGISDRPSNMADIFHTFFGIAGLSLLDYFSSTNALATSPDVDFASFRSIDPTYALPRDVVNKYGLICQVLPTFN